MAMGAFPCSRKMATPFWYHLNAKTCWFWRRRATLGSILCLFALETGLRYNYYRVRPVAAQWFQSATSRPRAMAGADMQTSRSRRCQWITRERDGWTNGTAPAMVLVGEGFCERPFWSSNSDWFPSHGRISREYWKGGCLILGAWKCTGVTRLGTMSPVFVGLVDLLWGVVDGVETSDPKENHLCHL